MISLIATGIDRATRWPVEAIVKHFANRLFELAMTCIMIAIAVGVSIWPESISAGSFRYLHAVISTDNIILIYGVLGLTRIAALIANGHWEFWGPVIRAIGALIGAAVWGQMAAALWLLDIALNQSPSVGIPTYGLLALFELISMYRALAGGRDGRKVI